MLGLLAVEGFLLLSESFHWFAFNQHKGYTVLIAVAAVVVAMLLMFLWFSAALVFRLRFQFSILSLLVLTAVVAIPCSWLAVETKEARTQREAVEEIRKVHGTACYDYQFDRYGNVIFDRLGNPIKGAAPPGPSWLHKLLGNDLFASVTRVWLDGSGVRTTFGWDTSQGLPHLQWLTLNKTAVTNAGLCRLAGLTQLQHLYLSDTKVSDVGMEHLKRLTRLQNLALSETVIGDAGLQRLKGLTGLHGLYLNNTRVGDAGLEHLKGLTELRVLALDYTTVSDHGLECVKRLTKLKAVELTGTNVTNAGVRDLQNALPAVVIFRLRYK